jgi:hypothetical protein
MSSFLRNISAIVLFTCVQFAQAQVVVKDAWVRATVPQQKASGAFFQITSAKDAKLVDVKCDVAMMCEMHEMAMENNVMKMREIDSLVLPAGKTVELKPGGFHLMLMGLKAPIKAGEEITLSLTIEGKDKKRETIVVKAQARAFNK